MGTPASLQFDRKRILRLMFPLFLDTMLVSSIGIVNSAMVSSIGEAAVSGVSLANSIGNILIIFFSAFNVGGTVIIAQFVGKNDIKNAHNAMKQTISVCVLLSTAMMFVCVFFGRELLTLLYGTLEPAVMTNATDYLIIVALSYPFFAFNSAVIGALRAVCDSKTALFISALMNILNVGGYAFFIFICDMNASGAAFSLLIVRIIGAALSAIFLLQGKSGLTIRGFFPFRFDGPIIKSICKVAIPVTAEIVLLMFDVMYHRIAKYLGPNALTAHSVGFSIITFLEIPASAICLTLMTVVGQLVGSGNLKEARYQINRMVIFSCFCLLTTAGIGYLCSDWFAALYHLSPQSSEYLTDILLIMMIALPLFWSGSFVTFNGLRAAGDGKFIIVVSIFTMCILRVGCGYLFAVYFGWGIRGLWSAMALDCLGRMIFFLWRKRGDKWYVNKLT